MNWLLFGRTATGAAYPVFGSFSSWGAGIVPYGIYFGLPAVLVGYGLVKLRAGKREHLVTTLWAVAAWLVFVLHAWAHLYPKHSSQWRVSFGLVMLVTACWAIYGLWRVVPIYLREEAERRRKKRARREEQASG